MPALVVTRAAMMTLEDLVAGLAQGLLLQSQEVRTEQIRTQQIRIEEIRKHYPKTNFQETNSETQKQKQPHAPLGGLPESTCTSNLAQGLRLVLLMSVFALIS